LRTTLRSHKTPEQQEAKSKGKGPQQEKDTAAERHAGVRQTEGFNLNEIVSEYRALRASVIRLWTHEMPSANRDALYEMTRFNEAIDQALTESIARYSKRLDRSRELFLGVLGHDLRSPLGAVLYSTQYLLHSDGFSGAQTKAVSAISCSGARLRDMISDLLDVARTRLGESLPIALHRSISRQRVSTQSKRLRRITQTE
jgi:signal transduction histidine kinase